MRILLKLEVLEPKRPVAKPIPERSFARYLVRRALRNNTWFGRNGYGKNSRFIFPPGEINWATRDACAEFLDGVRGAKNHPPTSAPDPQVYTWLRRRIDESDLEKLWLAYLEARAC